LTFVVVPEGFSNYFEDDTDSAPKEFATIKYVMEKTKEAGGQMYLKK
jgi:hypothetical protein